MAWKTCYADSEWRYILKSTLIIDPLILRKDRNCGGVVCVGGEGFVYKLPPKDLTEISITFTT